MPVSQTLPSQALKFTRHPSSARASKQHGSTAAAGSGALRPTDARRPIDAQ